MQAVCEGLAAAAATVDSTPELIAHAFTPDSVDPPVVFCAEYDVEFDLSMSRGLDSADITLRVLLGRADDVTSAARLNALLSGAGTGSLKTAIESDRRVNGGTSLGGACDDYRVERVQGMRFYEHASYTYLGAEFRVKVIGRST
jgi:hypothetical protein